MRLSNLLEEIRVLATSCQGLGTFSLHFLETCLLFNLESWLERRILHPPLKQLVGYLLSLLFWIVVKLFEKVLLFKMVWFLFEHLHLVQLNLQSLKFLIWTWVLSLHVQRLDATGWCYHRGQPPFLNWAQVFQEVLLLGKWELSWLRD